MLVVGPLKNLCSSCPSSSSCCSPAVPGISTRSGSPSAAPRSSCSPACCAGGPPATGSRTSASSCTPAGCAGSGARCPGTGSAPSTSRRPRCTGCSASASCRSGRRPGGASALDRSARMDLDAVSKAEAERLRRELLDRTVRRRARRWQRPAVEIARLDWSWLRFAPLTFSSLAGVGAVVGAGFNLLIEAGVDPRDIGVVDDTARRVATAPLWRRGRAGRRQRCSSSRGSDRSCCSPSAGPATGSPGSRTARCGCGTACSPRVRCRCRTSGCGAPR